MWLRCRELKKKIIQIKNQYNCYVPTPGAMEPTVPCRHQHRAYWVANIWMTPLNTLDPEIHFGEEKLKKQKGGLRRPRQLARSNRGEDGEMEVWKAEEVAWVWQWVEGRARRACEEGAGTLYLHEGPQDFPGFLVELLSIPMRIESLQLPGQPVVLSEKQGVGCSQQDMLRGSGISWKPRRQEGGFPLSSPRTQ